MPRGTATRSLMKNNNNTSGESQAAHEEVSKPSAPMKRKFVNPIHKEDLDVDFADLSSYQSTYDLKSFQLARVEMNTVTNKKALIYLCFCGKQCKMNTTSFKCAANVCGWSMDKATALYLQDHHLFRKVKSHNIPLCKQCESVRLMVPLSNSWYSYGIPTYVCACPKPDTVYFVVDKPGFEQLAANFDMNKVLSLVPKRRNGKKAKAEPDAANEDVKPKFGEVTVEADDEEIPMSAAKKLAKVDNDEEHSEEESSAGDSSEEYE
jgi:hypothetical protein